MDNGNHKALLGTLVEDENIAFATRVLRNCEVEVNVETETRDFSNGPGQSMKKLTFTIDLSKSEQPWQPHMDQAWGFSEILSKAVVKELDAFFDT